MTNRTISTTTKQTLRKDFITGLYVGYTHYNNWIPVMRISWDDEGYFYKSFTVGFQDHYDEIKGLVLNPKKGYSQTDKDKRVPYPLNNRIPHRADSMTKYNLYGLTAQKGDFIALVARNCGYRNGDNFDLFPEIKANHNGQTNFYFALDGLPTLIKQGSASAKAVADNIQPGQKLDLNLDEKGNIYCQEILIGHCPNYLQYLLSKNQVEYRLKTHIVNNNEQMYAYCIIIELSVHCEQNLYNLTTLETLNPMPV